MKVQGEYLITENDEQDVVNIRYIVVMADNTYDDPSTIIYTISEHEIEVKAKLQDVIDLIDREYYKKIYS